MRGARTVLFAWSTVFLIPTLLPSYAPAVTPGVGQWNRFEASIRVSKAYDDAFRDVTLEASFTSPDGRTMHVEGFYDGDDTWRVRFMPDARGTWQYEMEMSDGSATDSGAFDCVPSPIPGMLDVDAANPLRFGFRGGRHRIVRSLHVGDRFFASNWPDEKRTAFLDWAESQGYNMFSNESHHSEKPLYAQETLWAGNMYHKEPYTDVDLRKNAYVIGVSAAALNFGDMDGNSSSGFSGTLELDARIQERHEVVRRVWDFFETVPYYRMKPAQELVNSGFCLADPGREYLVYLEDGGTVDVEIDDGPYLIQWIDARNTFDRRYGGTTDDGQGLAAPLGGDDWLLRLRKPTERFSIKEDNSGTTLGGRPMLVTGLRLSNAVISDEKTQELIDHLDEFASYGVNTFSVFFQGSRFGDIRGYRRDASIEPKYAVRMGRLIEAAAERDMIVLVGVLYYGNSKGKWEEWGQADAERAVANTVRWLQQNGYRNVMVDVNNEHMAKFDDGALIAAGKLVDPDCVIATSGKATPQNADLSLHHGSPDLPGKYYIESEGTGSKYWGSYSKDPAVYNYVRIGEYAPEMKAEMLARTDRYLDRGQGYMFASTWLQCVPLAGPNHRPGGDGAPDDPGVRWWLEHLREKVGEHTWDR